MDDEASTITASEAELGSELQPSDSSDESCSQTDYDGEQSSNFNMPALWYNDPLFTRYWKQYKLAWEWYRYHCHISSMRYLHQAWPSPSPGNSVPQGGMGLGGSDSSRRHSSCGSDRSLMSQSRPAGSRSSSRRSRRRLKKKRLKRRKRALEAAEQRRAEASGVNEKNNPDDEVMCFDEDEDFFEMEITPEMVEFFAKSAKHKEDRDADRRRRHNSGSSDYIDISEASSNTKHSTTAPPSERPGVRRTEQMKSLYGSGAAMIHGMETAMQLNYDRNCDLKTPKPWPHLPLNIVFHS